MEQVGFVRKVTDGKAELEVRRASGCGSCKGCAGSCEVKAHIDTLRNTLNASPGDYVELKGESGKILKYMLVIYLIPFLFLIGGIVLGHSYFSSRGYGNYELLSFGIGILFLALSFFVVRAIDRRVAASGEETISMTKIL